MKNLLLFISLLLLTTCKAGESIVIDTQSYKIMPPPGTIRIKANFYADETEITNISYKEYLSWMVSVFGKTSPTYLEILADTTVWSQSKNTMPLQGKYHRHPMYNDYPVVGITLDQAKKYTEWRTERVAEMLLIRKQLIKPNYNRTSEDHFSLKRYQEGGFDWIISREDVLLPMYKIPSKSEWELIAGNEFQDNNGTDTGESSFLTSPSQSFSKNKYGLYGIGGNVAELVEEREISKGGSWKNKLNYTEDIIFDSPNSWTGFRNIATYELIEVGL